MSTPGHAPRVWAVGDADGTVRQVAAAVLDDPALRRLAVRLDGVELAPHELALWAAQRLDSRGGLERQTVRATSLDGPDAEAVLEAAQQLGITRSAAPSRNRYDCTVILGGTVLANTLRTALARQLLSEGTELGVTVAVGADRPLTASELTAAGTLFTTEAQHLAAAAISAFGITDHPGTVAEGASVVAPADISLTGPSGELRVLSAPPSDSRRRADTQDAIRYLVSRTPSQDRSRVLLVTSSMYMPYQLLVAAQVLLDAGTRTVEVVGTPASIGNRFRAAQVLGQEINGFVQAADRILAA